MSKYRRRSATETRRPEPKFGEFRAVLPTLDITHIGEYSVLYSLPGNLGSIISLPSLYYGKPSVINITGFFDYLKDIPLNKDFVCHVPKEGINNLSELLQVLKTTGYSYKQSNGIMEISKLI